MAVVTLLTDFGTVDEYVGVMKGVILCVNPRAVIVDITHGIAPQEVTQAAWVLKSSFRHFPPGTVHVAVVDPGVGTGRAIVALETAGHFFVAPDNGLLTLLLSGGDIGTAVWVENPAYFRTPVSRTFHGRDIFAPVGAHLSRGVSLERLGRLADPGGFVRLPIAQAHITPGGDLCGAVATVDHFGNLITNIDAALFELFLKSAGSRGPVLKIGPQTIRGLARNYQDGRPGDPLALFGSRGYLEIAVNSGSARQRLGVGRGDPVRVSLAFPGTVPPPGAGP